MKLSAIQSQTLRVPVALGDAVLNVEYCPARVTAKLIRELMERTEALEAKAAAGESVTDEATPVAMVVAEILTSWDLTDDAGKPVPITPALLVNDLGFYVTNSIWAAIQESLNPNSRSGAAA